jgi:hypothetical protein
VTYEVSGDARTALHCHCTRCRRWSGASFATMMVIDTGQLTVTQGSDQVQTYREAGRANRSFCKTCGSALFGFQWPDGPKTVVPLGSFDEDPSIAPAMHINVDFKAPWHEIRDELEQVAGFPGR